MDKDPSLLCRGCASTLYLHYRGHIGLEPQKVRTERQTWKSAAAISYGSRASPGNVVLGAQFQKALSEGYGKKPEGPLSRFSLRLNANRVAFAARRRRGIAFAVYSVARRKGPQQCQSLYKKRRLDRV